MTHLHLFDASHLRQVRLDALRKARALPSGPERNQRRQVAQSLKSLADLQSRARDDWAPVCIVKDYRLSWRSLFFHPPAQTP
jgi:hypothetical protein